MQVMASGSSLIVTNFNPLENIENDRNIGDPQSEKETYLQMIERLVK